VLWILVIFLSDPDPTSLVSKETKAKFLLKTAQQILILKKRVLKPTWDFVCPYSKIDNNQWELNRFHAILVSKNWSLSDPKLIITGPYLRYEKFVNKKIGKISTYLVGTLQFINELFSYFVNVYTIWLRIRRDTAFSTLKLPVPWRVGTYTVPTYPTPLLNRNKIE